MLRRLSKYPFNIICCTFTLILSALIFFPQSALYAADATLAWSANTEPDIDGYYIYYKTGSSGAPYNGTGAEEGNSPIKITLAELADSANPEYTIQGVSDTETSFFVVTAYDTEDNESGYSNEVSYQYKPPSNVPPSTPVIVYPENGQNEVEEPLNITAGTFSDLNGDAHRQSQWQISDLSDFSTLVVDITSDSHLTIFPVPHMILTPNQTYYVRIRFYDVYLEPSDWSRAVAFTPNSLLEDLNLNGIPDLNEVDDSVDFNLDGIPDIHQPEIIKCVQTQDGSAYICVEKISSSIDEIEAMGVIDPDTIAETANRPADLIFGLFSYRLRVNQPGSIATLKIYFSGEVFPSDTFFKYDTINGWYDYSEHTTFNHDGQSISLELKDGGYGDCDGLANGIIIDPSGIASSEDVSYDNDNILGCFIATAAFGSKFEKHVQLLRRFRDLYLMPHRIGRAFVHAYYRYSPPVAKVIANHETVRAVIRWSLLPLIGLSWMLLHFDAASTLLIFILMSTTVWVGYKRRCKAWRVKPAKAAANLDNGKERGKEKPE